MGKTIHWSEKTGYATIAALGLLIMALSASYGLGTFARPGPGMYPFVVGLLIFPLALALFIAALRSPGREEILTGRQIWTLLAFFGTCAFWILAMPLLGYVLVTLVAAFVFGKIMRIEGWIKPLLLSAGTALFIYLLFDVWLYIDLPRGFWA
jgi:hypothetical protein